MVSKTMYRYQFKKIVYRLFIDAKRTVAFTVSKPLLRGAMAFWTVQADKMEQMFHQCNLQAGYSPWK